LSGGTMPTLAANKIRLIVTGKCNLDCFYCHNEGQVKEDTFARVPDVIRVVDALGLGRVGSTR
jgi:molybdenum cofactor biosynthesis enzyme MoaA